MLEERKWPNFSQIGLSSQLWQPVKVWWNGPYIFTMQIKVQFNGLRLQQQHHSQNDQLLSSGYMLNETEVKLKQNSFVSVLFPTWLRQKNRNKTLKHWKRFRIVLKLF